MNTSRATTSLAKPGKSSVQTKKAPPGYVAGIGRGATGFTTRSDIGPTTAAGIGSGAAQDGAGVGRGGQAIGLRALRIGERAGGQGGEAGSSRSDDKDDGAGAQQERNENDGQFDQFLGNDAGMLGMTGEYDEDDKEVMHE